MNVTSSIQRRFGRVAIALTLVALVILGSVAFAYASSPRAIPVGLDLSFVEREPSQLRI